MFYLRLYFLGQNWTNQNSSKQGENVGGKSKLHEPGEKIHRARRLTVL